MRSPERFSGQSVVVTGASAGIGKALALKLAEEDAHVFAAARNMQKLTELQDKTLKGASGKVTPIQTDIRDAMQAKLPLFVSGIRHYIEKIYPHLNAVDLNNLSLLNHVSALDSETGN